jgi:hypothetical protein
MIVPRATKPALEAGIFAPHNLKERCVAVSIFRAKDSTLYVYILSKQLLKEIYHGTDNQD